MSYNSSSEYFVEETYTPAILNTLQQFYRCRETEDAR